MEDNSAQAEPQQQMNDQALLESVRERALKALAEVMPQLEEVDPLQRFTIGINAIRSTDQLDLLEQTLKAALAIEDKEVRANSLLDLVNEVNYLQDNRNANPTPPAE